MHTVTIIFGGLLVCYIICICKRNISSLLELSSLEAPSCLPLWDPMHCSPPGSSVHGIPQARILEWVLCHFLLQGIFPTWGSNPGPLIAERFWAIREAPSFLEIVPNIDPERWSPVFRHAHSLQLYLTLCGPLDCSPPGSSVYGILQARILEWVAIPSSRGSPRTRDQTSVSHIYLHWQAGSLPLTPSGKPQWSPICHYNEYLFNITCPSFIVSVLIIQ